MSEIKNAIIKSASINDMERGLLTAYLFLDYGGTGQGFGGYGLYLPKHYDHHKLLSHAGHFIWRCMEIGGVTRWEDLAGQTIRVKASHAKVEAIGHIVKDDWFCPEKDFSEPESERAALAGGKEADSRTCTCHPDDNPPQPCPRKFSLTECRDAAPALPAEGQK